MACIEKIVHERCGKKSLQTFYNEDSKNYSGYCFVCPELVPDPYGDGKPDESVKIKTKEENLEEIKLIKSLPTVPTKWKGITPETFKKFGVKQSLSEYDGKSPFTHCYPRTKGSKLVGYKHRLLSKKAFWSVTISNKADPFGYHIAIKTGAKRVYITEGEKDALSLYQLIQDGIKGTKYQDNKYAVVGTLNGASSIVNDIKQLEDHFKEIIYITDNDGAGVKSMRKAKQYYEDIMTVAVPGACNDVSDVLESKDKDLRVSFIKDVLWNFKKPATEGVVKVQDILNKGLQAPQMGLSYPWPGLNDLTYGQRFGEVLAIGAGVGLGKTLISHEVAAHNLLEHNEGSFLIHLEETNVETIRNIAGKIDSVPYHQPQYDDPDSQQDLIATARRFQDKILLWEDSSSMVDRFDIDEMIKAIRFNALEYGIRFIAIDNLTALISDLPTSEGNEYINKYSKILGNLAVELDVHIDIYSHLNPPRMGVSHEEGGEVFESQFTGSRGAMRAFPMMMSFRRNKYIEGSRKHNSFIGVLKNRKYGNTGQIRTRYDHETSRLKEFNWPEENLYDKKGK